MFENSHLKAVSGLRFAKNRTPITDNQIWKFLTLYIPMDMHRLKPDGLHTGVNNWNKQWKEFFDKNAGIELEKKDILNQLETMVEAHKKQFTQEGINEIMDKIQKLR